MHMSDTNQTNPDGSRSVPRPPKVFPDPATCRVKPAGFDDYYVCLSDWVSQCHHALYIGSEHYCRHPSAPEIYARSEVRKDKPA
jgi:hypothetical protein